jgi:hypothetical protein
MSPPLRRPVAQALVCAGRVHVERQESALLDLRAKAGPSRVALIEDGAVLCASCVHEINRGGNARF